MLAQSHSAKRRPSRLHLLPPEHRLALAVALLRFQATASTPAPLPSKLEFECGPEVFVPEAGKGGRVRWPFAWMKLGEARLVQPYQGRSGVVLQLVVCNACSAEKRRAGLAFKTRQQSDGSVLVRRVA